MGYFRSEQNGSCCRSEVGSAPSVFCQKCNLHDSVMYHIETVLTLRNEVPACNRKCATKRLAYVEQTTESRMGESERAAASDKLKKSIHRCTTVRMPGRPAMVGDAACAHSVRPLIKF